MRQKRMTAAVRALFVLGLVSGCAVVEQGVETIDSESREQRARGREARLKQYAKSRLQQTLARLSGQKQSRWAELEFSRALALVEAQVPSEAPTVPPELQSSAMALHDDPFDPIPSDAPESCPSQLTQRVGTAANDVMLLSANDSDICAVLLAGDDILISHAKGHGAALAGPGNDIVQAPNEPTLVVGGAGNDSLLMGNKGDKVSAGDGDDIVIGHSGSDQLEAGDGRNTVLGDDGNDALSGGNGEDLMLGGRGNDSLSGGGGEDLLLGGTENDSLSGDDGDDGLLGDPGDDLLKGGAGDDDLDGGPGNDTLMGGAGIDVLRGGPGDDSLRGGPGADLMDGGPGNDTFLLPSACEAANGEVISGGSGFDTLVTPLTAGELAALGVTLSSIEQTVLQADPCSEHGQCVADSGEGKVSCDCDDGFAGPACAIACVGQPDCRIQAYFNPNGSVVGLASSRAALFSVADAADTASVLGELRGFVSNHEAAFGFSPLAAGDIPLAAHAAVPPIQMGGHTLHRYVQTYRGMPVYGADSLVVATATPLGVSSLAGTLVDPNETYAGWSNPVTPAQASAALQQALQEAIGKAVTVSAPVLTAFPRRKQMGYVATGFVGPLSVGTAAVTAAAGTGGKPAVLFVNPGQVADINNQSPITARVEDAASDPFALPTQSAVADSLRDGSALTCADETTTFRLAQPSVFLRNSSATTPATYYFDLPAMPSFSSADSSFDASPDSLGFYAQDAYYKAANFSKMTGERLLGQWDSLLKQDSDFAPGTFAPRILVTLGESPEGTCQSGSACADSLAVTAPAPVGGEDFVQQPFAGARAETLGLFALQPMPTNSHVAHEFGHIVDLFVGAGWPNDGVECWNNPACTPSCQLGTPEESPALMETVATMYGIWSLGGLFDSVNPNDCSTLVNMSRGDNTAPHNSTCRAPDDAFDLLSFASFGPGFLPDNQGTLLPTGACGTSPGYRLDAIFQAWWELLTGNVCSAAPPFNCASFEASLPQKGLQTTFANGLGNRAPQAAIDAMLYALRVNSQSYEMFFDHMAAYYACNFGPAAHDAFCDIVEHHNIIGCDEPPACQVCGNGAVDPSEQCDDGNLTDTDACLNSCAAASCGDGVVWQGVEECDDGNDNDGDACTNSCTLPVAVCGDNSAEGTEECDGFDLNGESCSSLGAGDFGTVSCNADCTFNLAACSDCEPGTPGCRCLDSNNPGESNPALRENGILENGKYCADDVSFGGAVRCLELGGGVDICHSCTVGEGVWCPCIPQEGCLLGDLEGPATGQPGDSLFCAAACDVNSPGTCDAAPADTFGYCFVVGASQGDGGMPDWFPDQYCRNVDDDFTCVQQPGEAAVCDVGPGPACNLGP